MTINLDFTSDNKPVKGSLLISNPLLADRIFQRSVILICEHNENGTKGFIINKQSTTDVSESHMELDQIPAKLYYGGPVDTSKVNMIHKGISLDNSTRVVNDVYFDGDITQIPSLHNTMRLPLANINFFIGYSNWMPNQLQIELDRKNWIVLTNYHTDFIFNSNPNDMWTNALRLMGHNYKAFANFPIDPIFN